jgi:ABC-type Mn2+/Zn2+ transport system permease subunit
MFFIDIRTLFVNYVVINIIGLLLISILYAQIRKKFPKSVVIVISFAMSASGNMLIFFQDVLPDWLSIVVGNTLVISSTVVLLIGFEKFLNRKEKQIQNYILLFIFL